MIIFIQIRLPTISQIHLSKLSLIIIKSSNYCIIYLTTNTMMESEQSTVQVFIGYIKNISLHFQNLLAPTQHDLKGITNKTFKLIGQFQKFVHQYNKKVLSEIQNTKINVPLIFYRSIKLKMNDPNFMRYNFMQYELKYIFVRINLECHMHVQICKNTSGVRSSNLAYQKLQNSFIYMLHKKITQSQNKQTVSIKFFEDNAINFLQQIYRIMNGEIVCHKCKKGMAFNTQLKILMPPTVRIQTIKQLRAIQNYQTVTTRYYHEYCL